jgi:hypothetical protein
MFRPIQILKITDPVRNAEVTQIGDGSNTELFQFVKGLIGKRPIITTRAEMGAVIGRAVTKIFETQLTDKLKVIFPELIMPALLHLVDAGSFPVLAVYGRITVLYARAEQKAQLVFADPLVEEIFHSSILIRTFTQRKPAKIV